MLKFLHPKLARNASPENAPNTMNNVLITSAIISLYRTCNASGNGLISSAACSARLYENVYSGEMEPVERDAWMWFFRSFWKTTALIPTPKAYPRLIMKDIIAVA